MTGNVCELVPVLAMISTKGEFNKNKNNFAFQSLLSLLKIETL